MEVGTTVFFIFLLNQYCLSLEFITIDLFGDTYKRQFTKECHLKMSLYWIFWTKHYSRTILAFLLLVFSTYFKYSIQHILSVFCSAGISLVSNLPTGLKKRSPQWRTKESKYSWQEWNETNAKYCEGLKMCQR